MFPSGPGYEKILVIFLKDVKRYVHFEGFQDAAKTKGCLATNVISYVTHAYENCILGHWHYSCDNCDGILARKA